MVGRIADGHLYLIQYSVAYALGASLLDQRPIAYRYPYRLKRASDIASSTCDGPQTATAPTSKRSQPLERRLALTAARTIYHTEPLIDSIIRTPSNTCKYRHVDIQKPSRERLHLLIAWTRDPAIITELSRPKLGRRHKTSRHAFPEKNSLAIEILGILATPC